MTAWSLRDGRTRPERKGRKERKAVTLSVRPAPLCGATKRSARRERKRAVTPTLAFAPRRSFRSAPGCAGRPVARESTKPLANINK